MAFLQKPRDLPNMYLFDNPLPWVDMLKHLGNMIPNKIDCCQLDDIQQKKARYIDKNNSILQEFSFAHPICKMKLNTVYNCHFSGSIIWDIFSAGAKNF